MIWHTTQLEILQDDGAKTVKNSQETHPLIRAGLECRRLGRRLVIWHTTQLEILQDDGAKTDRSSGNETRYMNLYIRANIEAPM